jgi:hypothetical protein
VRLPSFPRVAASVACLAFITLGATLVGNGSSAQSAGQVSVSIGILPFHDESGSQVAALGSGAAQMVRQRLSSAHRDVVVKLLVAPGSDAAAGPATVEQMQAIGKQQAVRFVVQGGILPVEGGAGDNPSPVTASLYADVLSLDTGQTQALRVDGSAAAPAKGLGIANPASVDVLSSKFAQTPFGQALGDAATKLAEAIYQVASGAQPATAQVPQQVPPQGPATDPAGAVPPPQASSPQDLDAEVQQLIADAQNAVANYGGAAPQLADQVRSGLEQLNAALSAKADQLSRGEDTQATDQAIAQSKESLRSSISALMQAQVAGGGALPPGTSAAPREGVMTRLNSFAGDMLSLVQKIQELRALVGGGQDEAAAASQAQGVNYGYTAGGDPSQGAPPTEQPPGSVTGVVVQDGQPVGGAEVTETSTGTTTTTALDGTYVLRPLPPGLLGVLSIKQNGKLLGTGQVYVMPFRASLADFQLKKNGVAGTQLGVLGSSAVARVKAPNAGTMMGRVVDARGVPVARALIVVPAVGPVRTNSRGEFVVSGVPAGTMTISVQHENVSFSSPVTVGTGKPSAMTVVKFPAAPAGRGVAAAPTRLLVADRQGGFVHGHIRDQSGRDLPGVRVSLLRGEGALAVVTGAGGRFEIRNLSAGPYRVVVARPGFDTAIRNIALKANGDEKVDLTLKQVTPLVDTIRRTEATRRAALATAGRRSVVAPAGAANDKDRAPVETPAVKVPPVQPPGRAGLETVPRLAVGQVRGRVTEAQTRRPIAGVTVSVSGGGSAVTDGNGMFHIDGVRAGSQEIAVSRAGYAGQNRRFGVEAGKAATQDFALRPLPARTPVRR